MPRAKPFAQSIALAVLTQGIVMLAGLWLTPFLLHRLGAYQFGLWIVGQQVITYLTLLDFGVVALLPRDTAYAAGTPGDVRKLLARTVRVVLLQTPLVAAIGLLACTLIPQRLHELRLPAMAAASVFALLFPTRVLRALLEGLQDLAFIGWSSLSGWLVGFIVTITLLINGRGLLALAGGWFASQSVDAAVCFFRVTSRHRHLLPSRAELFERVPLRDQLGRGAWVSVGQIAQVLIYGTDAAIVGRLFGVAAIVPYNCTGKLIGVLSNQPQHIMRAAEPGLSQMRVAEGREKLTTVTGALSLAMLLVSGVVTIVTVAANPSFVASWVGPQFYSGLTLTALFALSMLLRHLNITTIYTLFAFGHERLLAKTSLVDGVLSTVLSITLASWMHSAAGVVLGSILSTCCVLLCWNGPHALARAWPTAKQPCQATYGMGMEDGHRPARSLCAQPNIRATWVVDGRDRRHPSRRRIRSFDVPGGNAFRLTPVSRAALASIDSSPHQSSLTILLSFPASPATQLLAIDANHH